MEFNVAHACRVVGVSPQAVAAWRKKDPKFQRLMETVKEAKKDFCDDALMDLVGARDPAAVIFVNKTLNRDRGYDQRVTVHMEGSVNQNHTISVKELSVDAKRMLLEEMRAKAARQLEDRSNVIDAEYEEVR